MNERIEIQKVKKLAVLGLDDSTPMTKHWYMFGKVLSNAEKWDIPKLNRWIGYAQALQVSCSDKTLDEIIISTREALEVFKDDSK